MHFTYSCQFHSVPAETGRNISELVLGGTECLPESFRSETTKINHLICFTYYVLYMGSASGANPPRDSLCKSASGPQDEPCQETELGGSKDLDGPYSCKISCPSDSPNPFIHGPQFSPIILTPILCNSIQRSSPFGLA